MARIIEVSAFIDAANLDSDEFDPSNQTGLSEQAYLRLATRLAGLGFDDVDFVLKDE